ncbi:hypothetical protein KI688_007617 [Linnemannia hyalina]|uniref:FAD/NAD(P)-binding domain-containing protein n=1 Tax=Linnemannia hyalina TaxID=64524 RepID=A0A9P7XIU7_9FUNG|nr:hypothetical protein KI688_007617 [Linnemannia hyalina]
MSAPSETIQPTPSTSSIVPPVTANKPPHVLIGGAGLAGLFLGILLERAGIPYEIFERSAEPRQLAFEQLGLLDELSSISKPSVSGVTLTDKLKLIGKSVASDTDIAVRRHLYNTLEKEGLLPKSDTKAMSKGYTSLVGTTGALDPVKYPGVLEKESESYFMFGDKDTPYTWVTFTTPGNRICWNIVIQLGLSSTADEQAASSDWTNQDNKKMLDEIRHFKTPYGNMGTYLMRPTLIRSPRSISRTNSSRPGRTDEPFLSAMLLPSSGAGAVNAMQGAVLLANRLYDIRPTNFKIIETALSDYRNERFYAIKDQYPQSYISAKLIYGHTFSERVLRQLVFNWLPKSFQRKQLVKDSAYRPQANFLPLAPKRGTMDVIPQRPSKHTGKR